MGRKEVGWVGEGGRGKVAKEGGREKVRRGERDGWR